MRKVKTAIVLLLVCVLCVNSSFNSKATVNKNKISIRISDKFSPTAIRWNSWIYLKADSVLTNKCYIKGNIDITKSGEYFIENVNPLMLIASPVKETPSYANMQYEWIPIINCNWLDVVNYSTLNLDEVTSETYLLTKDGTTGINNEVNREACGFYQFINPTISGNWICSKCNNKISDVYEFSDALHEHTRRAFNLVNGLSDSELKYICNDEALVMIIGYSQQFPSLNNYSSWGSWPASWDSKSTYLKWVNSLATNEALISKIKSDAYDEACKIVDRAENGTIQEKGLSFHIGWKGIKDRYHDLIMEAGVGYEPVGNNLDYAQHFHIESLYYYYVLKYLYTSGDYIV